MAEHSPRQKTSEARLGGVTLAMWTILQKLPDMRSRVTPTWRWTAATSTSQQLPGLSTLASAINLEQVAK